MSNLRVYPMDESICSSCEFCIQDKFEEDLFDTLTTYKCSKGHSDSFPDGVKSGVWYTCPVNGRKFKYG